MSWFNYNDPNTRSNGPQKKSPRWKPSVSTRRAALVLSYGPDWAVSFLVGGLFFVIGNISGYKREFSLNETSIQHTYSVHERITFTQAALIAVVAPLVLMPLTNFFTVRSFWDWHNSWLGVVSSCAFAGTTTNIVKITVGRPRPDLIDRCQPIAGSVDKLPYGLSTVAICTQTNRAILIDGWKSFFSGHSSLSFAGLGFFSFYLAGKLHLFDKRGHAGKAWISLTPLVAASLVAISRTMDNRHHWQDVLIGSAVGLAFAFFCYRQYFPPLTDKYSHLPYRPRIDWDDEFEAIFMDARRGSVGVGRNPSELPLHVNTDDHDHGMEGPHSAHGLGPVPVRSYSDRGGHSTPRPTTGRSSGSGGIIRDRATPVGRRRESQESQEGLVTPRDREGEDENSSDDHGRERQHVLLGLEGENGESRESLEITREALEVDKTYPSPKKRAQTVF